jgi:hypothetical protein
VPINHTELETKTPAAPPSARVKIQTLSGAVVNESKSKSKFQQAENSPILLYKSWETEQTHNKSISFPEKHEFPLLLSFLPLLPSPPPLPLSIVQQSM